METNLKYINLICTDLGGVGGHNLNIAGENEICTLLGGTGGHSLEINALNEICTIQGVTAGYSLNLAALSAIGATEYRTNLEAWKNIQEGTVLNYNPATDTDVALWLKSRSENEMIATTGSNQKIATKVARITELSTAALPSLGHIYTTESFAIELMVNMTGGSLMLRQNGGYSTGVPGYSLSLTGFQLSSNVSVIYNSNNNLNLVNQGWVHIFIVVDRLGFLDIYRNAVRVLHVDISAKSSESISNANAYLTLFGTNNYMGDLAYLRNYNFGSTVPTNIADLISDNYTTNKINATLLSSVVYQYEILGVVGGVANLYDVKSDSNSFCSIANSTMVYSDKGSKYILDKGYSCYRKTPNGIIITEDLIIPLLWNGTQRTVGISVFAGKEYIGNYSADVTHTGLDGYKIRFTDAFFDRSNATIWSDSARLGLYDSANTKDFHPVELNQRTITEWLNDGYKGRLFVKFNSSNYLENYLGSVENTDRETLAEVLLYSTNKTGINHYNVLKYTGDSRFVCLSGSNVDYLNNQCQIGYLQASKPMLVLRLDDGSEGTYTAWKGPLGLANTNIYVPILSDLIGTAGFMTWAEVSEMQSVGWEFGSHGENDDDIGLKTHAEIDAIIPRSKQTLLSHSISPANNFVPHKYGQVSMYVRRIAMQTHRSTHCGFTVVDPEGANPKKLVIDNLSAMRGDGVIYSISTAEGMAAIKAQFDLSISDNRLSIFYWHVGGNVSKIIELINYAKSINLEILTLNQALDQCKYLP